MKHGVKPTREQKKILEANGFIHGHYLVTKDLPQYLCVVKRGTSEEFHINKDGLLCVSGTLKPETARKIQERLNKIRGNQK